MKLLPKNKIIISLFSAVLINVILLPIGFQRINNEKDNYIYTFSSHTEEILSRISTQINYNINTTIANLNIISQDQSIISALEDNNASEKILQLMEALATNFSNYKQIRIIDLEGFEKIRINIDRDNQAVLVPDSLLQIKERRYYFKQSLQLNQNEIYISRTDLNVEYGSIETPYNPVIRFSKPIYNDHNEKVGFIIINNYIDHLFETISQTEHSTFDNINILNKNSFWLLSSNRNYEFGFMFDSLKNENLKFKNLYLWNKLNNKSKGNFIENEQLYIYKQHNFSSLLFKNQLKKQEESDKKLSSWILYYEIPINEITQLHVFNTQLYIGIALSILFSIIAPIILIEFIDRRQKYISDLDEINLKLEKKVKEKTQELKQKNIALIEANSELESFSYSVSHDLRAPLRHISGFSDLLLNKFKTDLPEKAIHYLNNIKESGAEMSQLIDNLLHFSRISRASFSPKNFNMNLLVDEVVRKLSNNENDGKIEFKIKQLPNVVGDYKLLRQVWLNLLSNAIKYSSNNDQIIVTIDSKVKNEFIEFKVKDNGVGFDMKYVNKLFGTFQRLHSNDEFEGTGIGLAIVKRIVKKHGGQVFAESELNKGATFYFTLPKN